ESHLAKAAITNLRQEMNDLKGKTDHLPTNFLVIRKKVQKDPANLLLTSQKPIGQKIPKGVKAIPPAAMVGGGAKEAIQKINPPTINSVQKKEKDQHLTIDHPSETRGAKGLG